MNTEKRGRGENRANKENAEKKETRETREKFERRREEGRRERRSALRPAGDCFIQSGTGLSKYEAFHQGFSCSAHRCPSWLILFKNRGPWFTWWSNQLPEPSIFPKRTPMVLPLSKCNLPSAFCFCFLGSAVVRAAKHGKFCKKHAGCVWKFGKCRNGTVATPVRVCVVCLDPSCNSYSLPSFGEPNFHLYG